MSPMPIDSRGIDSARAANVIWDNPSLDHNGSLPLGNGDVAVNVWALANGELVFYVAKSDACSADGRLLKLARIRIALAGVTFTAGSFHQELHIDRGEMTIAAFADGQRIELSLIVDANAPVVWVEGTMQHPVDVQVRVETWRESEQVFPDDQWMAYFWPREWKPLREDADTLVPPGRDQVVLYHRNPRSIWSESLDLQGMSAWKATTRDPLLGRTFGLVVRGSGLIGAGPGELRSPAPTSSFRLGCTAHTAVVDRAEEWLAASEALSVAAWSRPSAAVRLDHLAWWSDRWSRSWITAGGNDDATLVARKYTLQRYVTACAARGGFPIKFNGSLFTVEPSPGGDPDYRRWGPPYWFQNVRLAYWPMIAAGDADLMESLFAMYRDMLPFCVARVREYYGHGGAMIPETCYSWGAYEFISFGVEPIPARPFVLPSGYIGRHWSGALELLLMQLDRYDVAPDAAFWDTTILPHARECLRFFAEHYQRDAVGTLRIEPAQALETWWDCTDPMPEVAGLHVTLARLLDGTPAPPADLRQEWTALRAALPPVPLTADGSALAPAARYADKQNVENPELYAIHPFRTHGLGRQGMEQALAAYQRRLHPENVGWQQGPIFAAALGRADDAAAQVSQRARATHAESRFDGFYGPNYDWTPDQTHPGVLQIALQAMLMRSDGSAIHLLPAWPLGWDVSFRLHAPGAVVDAEWRGGRFISLEVSPVERRRDVFLPPGTEDPGGTTTGGTTTGGATTSGTSTSSGSTTGGTPSSDGSSDVGCGLGSGSAVIAAAGLALAISLRRSPPE